MPPRYGTMLRFNAFYTLLNAGVNFASGRFEPTYAYDIDPTLGSTAMPGFTELATLYRKYRVKKFSAKASFYNRESFPLTVYICPVNSDPGANSTSFQSYLSNKDSVKRDIGPLTGAGGIELRKDVAVASFAGIPNTRADDNTCGGGTVAPVNNIWLQVGLVAVGANVGVSGVMVTLDIDVDIEFYELATPAS